MPNMGGMPGAGAGGAPSGGATADDLDWSLYCDMLKS
jgi:hypothetical protein